jgi:hypothetical protein
MAVTEAYQFFVNFPHPRHRRNHKLEYEFPVKISLRDFQSEISVGIPVTIFLRDFRSEFSLGI